MVKTLPPLWGTPASSPLAALGMPCLLGQYVLGLLSLSLPGPHLTEKACFLPCWCPGLSYWALLTSREATGAIF